MYIMGCKCLFFNNTPLKKGLHAERTILWASICCPSSQTRVTSEKSFLNCSSLKDELIFLWKSFHLGKISLYSYSSVNLQRAQRVAMAAIAGRWEPSHTRQLEDLGLERLALRRTKLCERFARRTATNSRHMDMFTPMVTLQRKAKHGKKYREIAARTKTYHNSALPYLTRLLNQD